MELDTVPAAQPALSYGADQIVYLFDGIGNCLWANDAALKPLNLDAGRIVGRHISELFKDLPGLPFTSAGVNGDPGQGFLLTVYPVADAQGHIQRLVATRKSAQPGHGASTGGARHVEPAAVHDIAHILTSSLDIEEVYEKFASELRSLVPFDRMSIVVLEVNSQTAIRSLSAGLESEIFQQNRRRPLENSAVAWLVSHCQSLVESDLTRPGAVRFVEDKWLVEAGFRSGVRVPLINKDRAFGMFTIWSQQAGAYGPQDQHLLEMLAARIAPAIENARIYGDIVNALDAARAAHEQTVRIERMRAMGELSSGVAHDFNNSLAAILGRTQLVMSQTVDDSHLDSLKIIEQAARDSSQVVRRILDFARFHTNVELSGADANRLVENVVELTRHKWSDEAQSKGQTIEVSTTLRDVPPVLGNYAEPREVLTNLVINAYEAIEGDGVIGIATSANSESVNVSVSDTGVGMSEEVAQRVFDPFFTTKSSSGTGLGLSVAMGIISRHNGTIEVDSEEGVGTAITVSLPIAPDEAKEEPCEAAASTEPSKSADILVIEDEPLIRDTMSSILSIHGHRVTVASNGEEGIDLFTKADYDLVFTDLGMPGISGWEVARALKDCRSEVPVVMVTGWGVALEHDDVERSGVDGVLAKPFEIENLLSLISQLTEG